MRAFLFASFVSLAFAGCAGRGSGPPPVVPAASSARTVLVLPPLLETTLPVDGAELARALGVGLRTGGGLALHPGEPAGVIDAACFERLACLRGLGAQAGAPLVAASAIVGLGETAMVRVRLVDVRATGSEQTRQTVVEPASAATLAAALESIGTALAAPYALDEPTETRGRGRTRWRWLGPVLGAVLAGGVTATYLGTRPDAEVPDVVITPP